jgi:hypothetical protein
MNEQFTQVTLTEGSNRAYANTDSDLSALRAGSFLKIVDVGELYRVLSTEKQFFIKRFENLGNAIISIEGDVSGILAPGDQVQVSFKEYIVGEFFLKGSGPGYSVGDKLILRSANSVQSLSTGKDFDASFNVDEVDSKGCVKKLSIVNRGRYLVESEKKEIYTLNDGCGSGAEVEVLFMENGNVRIVEKTIFESNAQGTATVITLESDFVQNIKSGKLSFEKWTIELKHPHRKASVRNREATITRDFTPYLGLPIIPGTNDVTETHYNKTISILDRRIEALERKVNRLSAS